MRLLYGVNSGEADTIARQWENRVVSLFPAKATA